MGLSLERIMGDMQHVGFSDDVWPKFLRDNAARILKID
jgi:predicted TIM-barrel fold metal-dependent hydrolase